MVKICWFIILNILYLYAKMNWEMHMVVLWVWVDIKDSSIHFGAIAGSFSLYLDFLDLYLCLTTSLHSVLTVDNMCCAFLKQKENVWSAVPICGIGRKESAGRGIAFHPTVSGTSPNTVGRGSDLSLPNTPATIFDEHSFTEHVHSCTHTLESIQSSHDNHEQLKVAGAQYES